MTTTDVRTDTPGAAQQSAPLGDNKTKSGPAILIAVLALLALLLLGAIAVAFNGGGIGGAAQAPTGSNLRVAAANLLLDVTDRYFDNTDGTTVQLNQGGNNYSSMNITGSGVVSSTGSSGFELAVNSSASALTTLTLENGGTLQTAFINKAGASSAGILTFNNGKLVATVGFAPTLVAF